MSDRFLESSFEITWTVAERHMRKCQCDHHRIVAHAFEDFESTPIGRINVVNIDFFTEFGGRHLVSEPIDRSIINFLSVSIV